MSENYLESLNPRFTKSQIRPAGAHQRYSPPGSDFTLKQKDSSSSLLSASLPQSSSLFLALNSQRTNDHFNEINDAILSLNYPSDRVNSRSSSTSTLSQTSPTNSKIFSSAPPASSLLFHYFLSLISVPVCCLRMGYAYIRTIRKSLSRLLRRSPIIGRTRCVQNVGNSLSGSINSLSSSFRSQLLSPKSKHSSSNLFSNRYRPIQWDSLLKRIIIASMSFFLAIFFLFFILLAVRPAFRATVMEYFYFHNVHVLDIKAALEADAERRICDWKHGLDSLPAHAALESVRELLANRSRERQLLTEPTPESSFDELTRADQYALVHKVFLRQPPHLETSVPHNFRFDTDSYASLPPCPQRHTLRRFSRTELRLDPLPESEFEALFEEPPLQELEAGCWRPPSCRAQHRVAVLVPFRERHQQLRIFLRNMHPFLMRQQLAYCIFVLEQTNDTNFNRALLFNVGFLEAMRVSAFDCVVLHDVDTIAGDERIPYRCPRTRAAVHLAVAVEKYNFTLPFSRYFGGVLVVSREQFARINGASNVYFGWGGEGAPIIENRYALLLGARPRQEHDGLNSLRYELVRRARYRWATQVTVRVCHTLCLLCAPSSSSSSATAVTSPAPVPALVPPADVSLLAPSPLLRSYAHSHQPNAYARAHSLAHRPSIAGAGVGVGAADGDYSLVFRERALGGGGGTSWDSAQMKPVAELNHVDKEEKPHF